MPVVDYPLAILKFTWTDAPWQGNAPVGMQYTDAMINRMFLPLELDWGVAGYWRRATYGLINLEDSEVFPWRKLQNMNSPSMAFALGGRGPVVAQAVNQALARAGASRGARVVLGPRGVRRDVAVPAVDASRRRENSGKGFTGIRRIPAARPVPSRAVHLVTFVRTVDFCPGRSTYW
jgi:hypothetical protein